MWPIHGRSSSTPRMSSSATSAWTEPSSQRWPRCLPSATAPGRCRRSPPKWISRVSQRLRERYPHETRSRDSRPRKEAARYALATLHSARCNLRQVQPRGRSASTAVVTVIRCDESGWRQVLGITVVDTELYESWLGFLRAPRPRRPQEAELIASDAHMGLAGP